MLTFIVTSVSILLYLGLGVLTLKIVNQFSGSSALDNDDAPIAAMLVLLWPLAGVMGVLWFIGKVCLKLAYGPNGGCPECHQHQGHKVLCSLRSRSY